MLNTVQTPSKDKLLESNLDLITEFEKNHPRLSVEAMNSLLRSAVKDVEPWLAPLQPAVLAEWLNMLLDSSELKPFRLRIYLRRLVSFESFNAPISTIRVPQRPLIEVYIEVNWVNQLLFNKQTTFEILLSKAIASLDFTPSHNAMDESFVKSDKSLVNDFSREFFWRRLDVWIAKTGQTHEAGHNEDLPKQNPYFIKRCVREFVEHLQRQENLPEKIIIMEKGAARAELVNNFLNHLEEFYPEIFSRIDKVFIAEFSKDILDHRKIAEDLQDKYRHLIHLVYYHPCEFPDAFYYSDDTPINLQGKVDLLIHNNVYDQLASQIIKKIDGKYYEEKIQTFINDENPMIQQVLQESGWNISHLSDALKYAVHHSIESFIGPEDHASLENSYPNFHRWLALLSKQDAEKALQFKRVLIPISNLQEYFADTELTLGFSLATAIATISEKFENINFLINHEALNYYVQSFRMLTSSGQIQMTNLFSSMDNYNQMHTRDILRMDGSLITALNADLFKSITPWLRTGANAMYDNANDFVKQDGGSIKSIGLGILRTSLN